jgi:hypothetical protein
MVRFRRGDSRARAGAGKRKCSREGALTYEAVLAKNTKERKNDKTNHAAS